MQEIFTIIGSISAVLLGGFFFLKLKGNSLDGKIDKLKEKDRSLEIEQVKSETKREILKENIKEIEESKVVVEKLTPDEILSYWEREMKKYEKDNNDN